MKIPSGRCNMAAAMETEQLGVEIFETAECEEGNGESQDRPKLEPFYVERYSWSQLKKLLADTRKYHGYMMAKAPHDFMFVKRTDPDGPHSDRVYYLAMSGENRENTLFYSEIPKTINRAAVLMLSWKPLLDLFQATLDYGMYSREEELLRERKRIGTVGIAAYDYHPGSGTFLFQAGSGIYHIKDGGPHGFTQQPLRPNLVETSCPNIRMDPKLCPADPDWIAFIHSNDIWISNLVTREERRITYVHNELANMEEDPRSAGVATFVLQEEFDRYSGYWWCPQAERTPSGGKILRILYEENDESEVEIIHVTSPMLETRRADSFRYPKTGTANPKVTFKMSEIVVDAAGGIIDVIDKELVQPFEILFEGVEYIARAGWTPEGKHAWSILLDRSQTHLQIVLISPELFIPVEDDAMDRQRLIESVPDSVTPLIIYEETTDIWINIHDIFHVFPQTHEDEIEFIFASECKTGFRHLYKITSILKESKYKRSSGGLPAPSDFKCPIKEEITITSGEWEVLGRHGSNIWVDEARKLVYFEGTKDSPLEHHLYVTSYANPGEVVRLTDRGYSHSCCLSRHCDFFISKYSNQKNPHCVSLYKLSSPEDDPVHKTKEFWATILDSAGPLPDYTPPEIFSFESTTGFTLYGMLYKPHDLQPGKKYPTVLFIYGGPQVQLVNNRFKGVKYFRLNTLASLGYVVVVIDNRGSCHRGLKFEGAFKYKMGQIEIDDQVEGLQYLASQRRPFPPAPPSPRAPLRLHRARFRAVRLAPPSPAVTMIIYRDLISHDELFSDIYKIREIADGLCLEVEGKMVSRTEGAIDDSLIGGNASAEGPEGEGTESTVVTGVDIVMNHHLQETSFTKEAYKKYIKDYMKSLKGKLEEQKPERVKPFMTGAAEQIKHILANFNNYQFFIGENMNPDGMVALLDYREDGVTPFMIFFKDGLEMEKC